MGQTTETKTPEYIPFGPEWVKEMKKLPKEFIIQQYKNQILLKKEAQAAAYDALKMINEPETDLKDVVELEDKINLALNADKTFIRK